MADLNPCIVVILDSIDCNPRHSIIESLLLDFDEEILDETREKLFTVSCEKLAKELNTQYGPPTIRGQEQTEEALGLKRRVGDKRLTSICNDIYELYAYNMDFFDHFPRGVLGGKSHVPEVQRPIKKTDEVPKAVILEHGIKIMELSQKIIDLTDIIESMRKTHVKDIKMLNDTINQLTKSSGKTETHQPKVGPTAAPVLDNKNANVSTEAKLPAIGRGRGSCRSRNESAPVPCRVGIPTRPSVTQVDKNKNLNETPNSIPVVGHKSSSNTDSWSTIVRKQRPEKPPTPQTHSKLMSRPLSGVKHEKGATFYIENIEICDGEQDKDIKQQVINQAKANNIRIMQCYVIHNRISEYRVGCKIVVPQSAAKMVTQPHIWPDPVRCREWVQRGRYTRSRQSDSDYLDYDDIHKSSTEYSASNYREWHDNMYQNDYVE